jgi:hypothetical protein
MKNLSKRLECRFYANKLFQGQMVAIQKNLNFFARRLLSIKKRFE